MSLAREERERERKRLRRKKGILYGLSSGVSPPVQEEQVSLRACLSREERFLLQN